jgi:DNA (cytosine-5)-methyltransferase 1
VKFGSVCSGIEAASVAWEPLGYSPTWFAEIEKFPSKVLAHHWPQIPNLGDMTTLPDRIASGEIEAPEVLVGGTPCQAFSVAGLRKGLADARGNLTLTYVEIFNAIDDARAARGESPPFCVWENVPGVLSDKTNGFGCLLAGLVKAERPLDPPGGKRWPSAGVVSGGGRIAVWRVLDAQHFGVPQRRRRVFVVCGAGDASFPSILFESQGLRWNPKTGREKGKGATSFTPSSFGKYIEGCGTLRSQGGDLGGGSESLICMAHGQGGAEIREEQSPTLTCNEAPIAFNWQENHCFKAGETTNPLRVSQTEAVAVRTAQTGANGIGVAVELSHTMDQANGQAVAFAQNQLGEVRISDISGTLNTNSNASGRNTAMAQLGTTIRRLTPTECERLQGFPDGHTNIPGASDGPRYKALGNSMAVPCMRFIGQRLLDYSNPTMRTP